jgi:hypothetical protein
MPIIPPPSPPSPPAPPGNQNLRTANDLLVEISLHLVEDIVNTTLTANVPSGVETITVGSTIGMYAGASVVIANSDGSDPDILVITAFNPTAGTITANFPATYAAGSTLLGGTFPTQQPTDPLFTQPEILTYLAQAQNEFLTRVPLIFNMSYQLTYLDQEYQALPGNAVELERISINGVRLYENSQSELSMADPNWANNTSQPTPTSWFEDRSGFYGWGLAPIPQAQFSCFLLTSIRGGESLGLLDLFLVPDIMIHFVKYGALSYIWEKDGEQQSPTLARLAKKRFESGVAIASRFLDGIVNSPVKRG